MVIKINAGIPSLKKSFQWELDEDSSKMLFGKKIGDVFKGELIGKPGYEFLITGGSDNAGFPMRWDVDGDRRKRILVTRSIGNRKKRKGMRIRKTVAGNTVGASTVQLNVKVVKEGSEPLIPVAEESADGGEAGAEQKE